MARFNSSLISNTISGTASVGSPFNGSFTALTGTAPYTITLANPTLFPGVNQQFYNATSGTVTLSTPSGNFVGTGGSAASTLPVYAGNVVSVTADGTNYIVISEDGSALVATSATVSGVLTVQSSGGVAIAPSTTGAIDNVNVGATTRGSGAFNTLTANNAVSFTANTASTTTGTGTVVITGGLGVSGTINATSVSASLTGTVQTAAQPNITSVGALTGLAVDTNTIYVDATNHRLGVGTSSPANTLDVRGTLGIGTASVTSTNALTITSSNTSGQNHSHSIQGPSTGTNDDLTFNLSRGGGAYGNFTVAFNAINRLFIPGANLNNSGNAYIMPAANLGIGTTTPGAVVEIYKSLASTTTAQQMLIINTDYASGIGTGFGGSIVFRGRTAGNALQDNAQILGYNEDINDNGYALGFFTRPTVGAGMVQRMTIQRGGNVGIGTVTPQAKLHVNAGSGAISMQDYKRLVYNLDATVLEGATYQRFSIGINTSVTTYPRTSAYVRVTVVPNPDGGIGLVYSSTAEFSIWRIDGNNNANFKIISVDNGTIGIATPVASNNSIIFGFTMPNNGTSTTPSFTIRVEIIAADVNNYVFTPITTATAHTGTVLSGYKVLTSDNTRLVGIGTTGPATQLHVVGTDSSANRTNVYNVMKLTAESGQSPYNGFGPGLVFAARAYTSGIVDSARISGYVGNDSIQNTGGSLGFDVSATVGSSLYRALTIGYNGNVGIGTTSPSTKLHIVTNNADPYNTVDTQLTLQQGGGNAGSGTQINFVQGAGTNWIRSVVTGANSATGSALAFGTAATGVVGTERMRINKDGLVGIGTNNPAQALDVYGNIQSSANIVGPLFFVNRANTTDSIAVNSILNLIEVGGGGSYNSFWHFGQMSPIANASDSPMSWGAYRFIFRLFNTGQGVVSNTLQMMGYYYPVGYYNMGSAFSFSTDGTRGYSTVVGPWITPAIMASGYTWGDVDGVGVKVTGSYNVTFGPAYIQYKA
jgi:hypothetical protein